MKTKSKHRWLALFMVVAMLIGTLPITVFAEDNTHTEDCYAKAGDLLCTIAESEGHTHTADCVCPGGENICGLKESEGHTHNESCYTYDDKWGFDFKCKYHHKKWNDTCSVAYYQ